MKNIKHKRTGRIFRVTNAKAKGVVPEGNWTHTTRGAMRAQDNEDVEKANAARRLRNKDRHLYK